MPGYIQDLLCVCVLWEWRENLCVGVCVWLRLHIYECCFCTLDDDSCSLKLIYRVKQLLWYPSGWLVCHGVSLVFSLPLCLNIAALFVFFCSLFFFFPRHDFCVDALPALDNNSASISCAVAGFVRLRGRAEFDWPVSQGNRRPQAHLYRWSSGMWSHNALYYCLKAGCIFQDTLPFFFCSADLNKHPVLSSSFFFFFRPPGQNANS